MIRNCFLGCVAFVLFTPLLAQDGVIPTPEETVRSLYDGHLKDGGALAGQRDDPTWEFRFEDALLRALRAEHWNFDPLWFAQDDDVKEVKVRQIDDDGRGGSLVLVSFVNFGEPIRLVVSLNHTDHGHRIVNIVDPNNGASLVRDLAHETD